jgi:hypothetical protein
MEKLWAMASSRQRVITNKSCLKKFGLLIFFYKISILLNIGSILVLLRWT